MQRNTKATTNTPAFASHRPMSPARRSFLSKLIFALGGLVAAVIGLPVIGYLIAPLFKRVPNIWHSVGKVTDFQVGHTVEVKIPDPTPLAWAGVAAQTAAYLRRDSEDQFIAFAVNCTHLGCPVHWLQDAGLFMCPCHGGIYYQDGRVAAGPPPHALPRYNVRVNNGNVEIQTSGIPLAV